jgi:aryl-alcohol dehydrogenase-like predicted oxidoreductase
MKYATVSGVDKQVSRLVQGTMMLSTKELEKSMELLDSCLEAGCNTFDCAHCYGGGDCERAMGTWLSRPGLRQRVVIITKGAHPNADRRRVTPFDISSDLHDSLARLKTEYIDIYLLHRDDPAVPVGPIVEILNDHVRGGRIKAFGGSNWSHQRIDEANQYAAAHSLLGFAASSPNFSLAQQLEEPWAGCVSISGPAGEPARQWYARHNMPLFFWSSLAGGFFSGRFNRQTTPAQLAQNSDKLAFRCYCDEGNLNRLDRAQELARKKGVSPAQIALAYVLCQPLNAFAITGSANKDELRQNASAVDIPLTPQEMAWLDLSTD